MRAERIVLAALIGAVALPAAPVATACGPDFPIELLADRSRAMAELPEGVFVDEVATLVPSPGAYVVQVGEPEPGPEPGDRELALYDRGAAAYHAGDWKTASASWTALLRLPPAERHERSTWAAYMLGRIDSANADAHFAMVRRLVDDGYGDALGLAAASFGEQALHHDGVARVRLYAQQAALGDEGGATSLLIVIRELVDGADEDELLGDPLGQRLLAIYLDTRSGELSDAQRTRIWSELAAIPHPAGADRLAAAAYRNGDWALAERLVTGADDTAIARWVRAKLALRAGDRATAARLLTASADGYGGPAASDDPADYEGYSAEYASRERVEGERAILAIADGRAAAALAAAWEARRVYRDALYIAERVVTIAELRAFVDALPPITDPDDHDAAVGVTSMRALLGRRLMRAGRYAEAVPYLPREHRAAALGFAASMAAATATGDRFAQARALYDASTIARIDGLEILGTEHAPDWATYGASYDLAEDVGPVEPPGPWLGPDEHARLRASEPAFSQRYHYRYLASQLAEQAADRLPHQSQAFAATLCWSARYVFFVDTDRVQRLYHRYVAHGPAAVDMDFGQTCPEPDFDRARRFDVRPRATRWQLALPIGAVAAIGAALAAVFLTRRRRFRFAARP